MEEERHRMWVTMSASERGAKWRETGDDKKLETVAIFSGFNFYDSYVFLLLGF